jgi:undecaprenyl diphosphate synthase
MEEMQLPKHVALIVDGNRRWARSQGLPFFEAYRLAGSRLVELVCTASHFGISHVTAFLFSTENWKRNPDEVTAVMTAFEEILFMYTDTFRDYDIRVRTIGDVCGLPTNIQKAIQHAATETAQCHRTNFIMAFNYGGRWDMITAINRMLEQQGQSMSEHVTEHTLASFLSTAPFGDPDLLIRTGGQHRVSNFLLWQLAYTELYFSDLMWPDFSTEHFKQALANYANRDRRLGGR